MTSFAMKVASALVLLSVSPTASAERPAGSALGTAVGKPQAAVTIKFDTEKRYEVGQPIVVLVTVGNRDPLDALAMNLRAHGGLQLVSEDQARYTAVTGGSRFELPVHLLAMADGSYRLSVIVQTWRGSQQRAKTLSTRIVVGNPTLEKPRKNLVVTPDGERLHVLNGLETDTGSR